MLAWAEEDRAVYEERRAETLRSTTGEAQQQALAELDAWLEERPNPLRGRPEVLRPLRRIWEGFWELDGSRQIVVAGGGMVPAVVEHRRIPFEVLQQWLDRRGYEDQHRAEAEHLLAYLDSVYRQHLSEQRTHDEGDDG